MASKNNPVTLYHPVLPDVSVTVAADRVDEHTKAGWRKTETKAVTEARKAEEARAKTDAGTIATTATEPATK